MRANGRSIGASILGSLIAVCFLIFCWGCFPSRPVNQKTGPAGDSREKEELSGWVLTWGAQRDDYVMKVKTDLDGEVYACGGFCGKVFFPNDDSPVTRTAVGENSDAFLVKYSPNGALRWVRTWGGEGREDGRALAIDKEDNVYVVGYFQGPVDFNPTLMRDVHNSQIDGDGQSYAAFLVKYDSSGNYKWSRTWAVGRGELASELAGAYDVAAGTHGVFVTGFFEGTADFDPGSGTCEITSKGSTDIFLSKFDSEGEFQWCKTFGSESALERGYALAIDQSGGVYLGGSFGGKDQGVDFDPGPGEARYFSNGGSDAFLCKYDEDGNLTWARTWGTADEKSWDVVQDVELGQDDTVYAGGGYDGPTDFDPGTSSDLHRFKGVGDCFVTAFDANGGFKWARTWGGEGLDTVIDLAPSLDGDVYVAGIFEGDVDFDPGRGLTMRSALGSVDAFLTRLDAHGGFRDVLTWGGPGIDHAYSVAIAGDRCVYVGGFFKGSVIFLTDPDNEQTRTAVAGSDCFLLKLRPR